LEKDIWLKQEQENNFVDFGQANYTEWMTAAVRRILGPTLAWSA
jgi:hypothetical protein